MLISTTDQERFTQEERIGLFLRDLTAIDPDTGAELYRSNGRRKSGRGARYTCSYPTGEMRTYESNHGTYQRPMLRTAFTVTAHTEREAIERANKALARFVSKGPRWDDTQYNWVFRAQGAAQ